MTWWLAGCSPEGQPSADWAEQAPVELEQGPTGPAPPPAVPISGGALITLSDGGFAFADAQAGVIYGGAIEEDEISVRRLATLGPRTWPFRLAEGADGALWIVLRGTSRLARWTNRLEEFPVCREPRGLAVSPEGHLGVACAEGLLRVLDQDGQWLEDYPLDFEPRDVVAQGDAWWVAGWREVGVAKIQDGEVAWYPVPESETTRPTAGWRLRPDPVGGGVLLSHQLARTDKIDLTQLAVPPYSDEGCAAAVRSAVTRFDPDGVSETARAIFKASVPVDLLGTEDGDLWLVSAGADGNSEVAVAQVSPADFQRTDCVVLPGYAWAGLTLLSGGRVSALTALPGGLLVGIEAPLGLAYLPASGVPQSWRPEPGGSSERGLHLFHAAPTGSIACASCHPEGRDDAHTWRFDLGDRLQVRRTQSLAGGIALATPPLHWDGSLRDIPHLLEDTFVFRMGGQLQPGDAEAFGRWLGRLPRPRGGPTSAAAERGELLFAQAGCDRCHQPPWGTDGMNHDVGTGEPLQTPPLVGLAARGPWLHDGCAQELEQRFDPACGGDRHGAAVPEEDLPDLIAYLRTW